jgi:hypothetical protein
MTLLILADASTDATAVRLSVLANEFMAATLVAPVELALAERWAHRVQGRVVRTTFTTRGGITIDSETVVGVFNRLWMVPAPALKVRTEDREYAQAELHALVVSWLAALRCPVINPASPHALCGSPLSPLRWHVLAHRAGLEPLAMRFTTSQRRFPAPGKIRVASGVALTDHARDPLLAVGPAALADATGTRTASMLVVADDVWPEGFERDEAMPLAESCVRLARAAGLVVMRVNFVSSADETSWLFTGVDATPDVVGDEQLMAILAALATLEPAGR